MGCFCCGGLNPEIKALHDCYPPSKDLVKSGPEFMPMSQDLSKLTYLAKNKPSSLAKIGDELEKRIIKEAKGSTGGYPKSRAGLLISLVVLHKLLTECKRDIGLFARQSLRAISAALDVKVYQSNNKPDLESAARASNCFVAFTQGTDGSAIGVDDSLTSTYLEVVKKFASFANFRAASTSEKPGDDEDQSRSRLIGLRGLTGASTSDAAFSAGSEFQRQARIIVPSLLTILNESPLDQVKNLTRMSRRRSQLAPLITSTPAKPRPPPSLSEHVVGEKGPSSDDVTAAAFRCLYELVAECHTSQASAVLDVVLEYLDREGGWRDVERCCLLAESLAQAMLLQSRFVVPTRLVELLVNLPDSEPPTEKHTSLLAMITTVFTSSVSLVGLAVTDILSSLISVIERRVALDKNDGLIPPLVTCVSSLGTHIYYVDQINDIVEETTLQMMTIPQTNPARQDILRVLIHCITGVMNAADKGDEAESAGRERPTSPTPNGKGKAPAPESPAVEAPRARDAGRRNPIAPEVWQETLPLLCESSYPVRAAYARALIFYLRTELPRDKRPRPDEANITRFCNALNAAVYTLAMSSRLGVGEPLPSGPPTPSRNSSHQLLTGLTSNNPDSPLKSGGANGNSAHGNGTVAFVEEPTSIQPSTTFPGNPATKTVNGAGTPGTPGSATPPRKPLRGGRRVSLPLNRLVTVTEPGAFDSVATPYDYAAIISILDELHAAVPSAALETTSPMLFALDADAGSELGSGRGRGSWALERRRACRETLLVLWIHISRAWAVSAATQAAEAALSSLPEPFVVPATPAADDDEPAAFVKDESEAESAAANLPLLDRRHFVRAFASATAVQAGTGRDAASLTAVLGDKWSVEEAIQNSVERFSRHPPPAEATQLMAIPNASYQSFGRPVSRPVDVGDLRDALAGGGDREGAGLGSAAQSVASTALSGATGSGAPSRAASPQKNKPDAKEILKEIFKEKKSRPVAASAPA